MRLILVGVGGWGWHWVDSVLPAAAADGLVELVALVDRDEQALLAAAQRSGLAASSGFASLAAAAAAHPEADVVAIVVPPSAHRAIALEAFALGLDVISEKPLADTLAAGVEMVRAAEQAGRRLMVTMNHRFDQDKHALREALRGEGRLDYLACRLLTDARAYGSWGADFRHEMQHPLLIEAAIHHLDLLADLAGGSCTSVHAITWRPPFADYKGDPQAVVVMEFDNGSRALYEGCAANATALAPWHFEQIRAETETATLVLDHRELVRHRAGQAQALPLPERPRWRHEWLIEQLRDWHAGGAEPATSGRRHLESLALVFAAISSAECGRATDPREVLSQAVSLP